MKSSYLLVSALTALAISVSTLCARTLYVSPKGDDANDGSDSTHAFGTLQKAADAVEPGDTVLVGDGIYTDDRDKEALVFMNKSGRPDAWITFKAAPGAKPELRPSGWAGIRLRASYYVIDGLAITGNNDSIRLIDALKDYKNKTANPYYNTNGIMVDGRANPPDRKPHHVLIRHCVVSKMPGAGIGAGQSDYFTIEDNLVFENCWFMRYAGSGIGTNSNWAFDDAPGYHVIIQRNKLWNNKTQVPWGKIDNLSDGNGIIIDVTDLKRAGPANPTAEAAAAAEAAAKAEAANPTKPVDLRPEWKGRTLIANNLSCFNGGSGIHTFRAKHVDIVNNTTYWNGQTVNYEEIFANNSEDIVIMNNIAVPAPAGRVTTNSRNANVRWDYNLYPVEQTTMKGSHDIVADPMFVKVARDLREADFSLREGSPAIDSASKEFPQPIDLLGKERAPDQAPDRGALEYGK